MGPFEADDLVCKIFGEILIGMAAILLDGCIVKNFKIFTDL